PREKENEAPQTADALYMVHGSLQQIKSCATFVMKHDDLKEPAMNCRNCGAAMRAVGGRSYFRCGYCGTFEFPQSTEDGVTTLGDVSGYACPVCTQPLTKAAIHGHSVYYCGTCRGFLTTNPDFTSILAHRREEVKVPSSVPRSLERDELHRRVGCPNCKKKMDTHPYGGGGNVVVDTCYRCKLIWLDAGEITDLARHRPKEGVTARLESVPSSQAVGRLSEPTSGQRWSRDTGSDFSDSCDGIWDVLKRLF
ncbi:MAG: zf-TFIIB domain-containing protein, partial [Planctomycetes bacterium]|nr:zf-TFIIB domain-containing protein [Planctomycetota bacterium]